MMLIIFQFQFRVPLLAGKSAWPLCVPYSWTFFGSTAVPPLHLTYPTPGRCTPKCGNADPARSCTRFEVGLTNLILSWELSIFYRYCQKFLLWILLAFFFESYLFLINHLILMKNKYPLKTDWISSRVWFDSGSIPFFESFFTGSQVNKFVKYF